MPKSSAQTDTTTVTDTDINKPSWDTSPNTFAEYWLDMQKWILTQDSRYRGYIQYGLVTSKDRTYYTSVNHELSPRH